MIDEILDVPENRFGSEVKIYSKRAVIIFALFMTTLFGGVMLYHNLKDTGKQKEAGQALLISFLYTIAIIVIAILFENLSPGVFVGFYVTGAYLLGTFFDRHIPRNNEMEKKEIKKPLLIAGLIIVVFIGLCVAIALYTDIVKSFGE